MLPLFTNIGSYIKTAVNVFNVAATAEVDGAAVQLVGPGYQYKSAQIALLVGVATGTAGTASVVATVQQSADGSTNWTTYTDLYGKSSVTLATPATLSAATSTSAASYVSATGVLTMTISGAPLGSAPGNIAGYNGVVAGLSGSGADIAKLNGTWPLISIASSGTVFNLQAPVGLTATPAGATTGTLAFTSVAQQTTQNMVLQGAQAYVRLAVVPTLTGSVTAIPVAGVIVLGGTSEQPAV